MNKLSLFLLSILLLPLVSCTTQDGGTIELGPLKTSYFKGDDKSSIMVEVYSDYECPACGYFEKNTMPLMTTSLIDTRKIKYAFHDFPLSIHTNAFGASESAYCAGDQGKYWEMHEKLFQNQEKLFPATIKQIAKDLSLNEDIFNLCVNKHKYKSYIDSLVDTGNAKGVTATPSIFINGSKVEGAISYEDLISIITKLGL